MNAPSAPPPTAQAAPEAGVRLGFRGTFHGPSPYGADPVVIAEVAIGARMAGEGPARCARMAAVAEGWFAPPIEPERCDTPAAIAGFAVAWALAALNRADATLHVAAVVEDDGPPVVALGFHEPGASRQALQLALSLFADPAMPAATVTARLDALAALCRQYHPDFQMAFLLAGARAADIPCVPFAPPQRMWQFGWGARGELFVESECRDDSAIGALITKMKPLAKRYLRALGVPVAEHLLVHGGEDLAAAGKAIGWPCVVKPASAGRSKGVVTDIVDLPRLEAAVQRTLADYGAPVMIESQIPGDVYRILVLRGRVVSVVRRCPVRVTGDGRSTVRGLIAARNDLPAAQRPPSFVAIPLDEECAVTLARQGLALDAVPAAGRIVDLRRIPMLTSGGVYDDVTAETHPDTVRLCEMTADSIGLANCGIDFITPDIARPMTEQGAVLELNTFPGLRVHSAVGLDPAEIGRLALGDGPARIPAALLLAPAARLAEVRGAARFDDATGWVVGHEGGVGAMVLAPTPGGGLSPPPPPLHRCATMVVRHRVVARVFIAAALEDVVGSGLPLDRFDTVVCLDCAPDPAWETVLRGAAGAYSVTDDLAGALHACGVAGPDKAASRPRRGPPADKAKARTKAGARPG